MIKAILWLMAGVFVLWLGPYINYVTEITDTWAVMPAFLTWAIVVSICFASAAAEVL